MSWFVASSGMVRVEPVTLAWAQALAQGDDVFAERFGVPVEPGWSGFPEVIPRLGEAIADGRPTVWGSLQERQMSLAMLAKRV
ncbi:MAG: hypothetical protein KY438_04125 [Actinobacteria bacterium]|nr:hypothetical protein [Actinomycetota bacterium]